MMIYCQPILFYVMLFTIEKMLRSVRIDNFVMNEAGLLSSTHLI